MKLDSEKKTRLKEQMTDFRLFQAYKWADISDVLAYVFPFELSLVGRKLTHQSLFEVVWTVVPALILVVLAVPSLKLLYSLDFLLLDYEPIITVKVLGHQWYWSYEYIVF